MKNKIKTITFYDLDDTIFRVPTHSSIKLLPSDLYTLVKDHVYDFYDNPVSLSDEYFDITIIENTLQDILKQAASDSTYNVLITHRVKRMEPSVLSLLDKAGILGHFDELHFLGRASKKSETVDAILDKYSDTETIRIFEDSIGQIFEYNDYIIEKNKNRLANNKSAIDCTFNIVGKSTVVTATDFTFINKQRLTLSQI